MIIKVKNVEGLTLPSQATSDDAGYDVIATSDPKIVGSNISNEDHLWSRIDYIEYETNLYIAPEDKCHTIIHPRSSISKYNLVLANSVGLIDCVPAGTKIKLFDGSDRNVEDIFNEDSVCEVSSFNEESQSIEKDVLTDMWIKKDVNLVSIELENGDFVEIPETKQVYTSRGWIFCKNLVLQDNILTY